MRLKCCGEKKKAAQIFWLAAILYTGNAQAQLPSCSGPDSATLYYNTGGPSDPVGGNIYMLDPLLPLSATNPALNSIVPPVGAGGLVISTNLNGGGTSPTFYTVLNGNLYYYEAPVWVNTGHSAGSAGGVNLGGGNGFIYILDGVAGQIFKYDGTGDAVPIISVPALSGVADLAGDCSGNFYYLQSSSPQSLQKYNSDGVLIATYAISGVPAFGGGGGLAIIGDHVYFDNASDFYSGIISGGAVNFTASALPNPDPKDFAVCSAGSGGVLASIDTGYYCGTGPGIPVTASGVGPFTWTVLNGPAIISGTGDSVILTATGDSRILVTSQAGASCGSATDTITLIVPTALVDAGVSHSVFACNGLASDTLHGSVTNQTAGLNYSYEWQPAGAIISGVTSLDPVIQPAGTSLYTLTVSTAPDRGGCVWSDTVSITVRSVLGVHAGDDTAVCLPATLTLSAVVLLDGAPVTDLSGVQLSWSPSAGLNDSTLLQPVFSPLTAGDYAFVVSAAADQLPACIIRDTVIVHTFPPTLLTNVTPGQTVRFGDTIQLNAEGAVSYQWLPALMLNDPQLSNPTAVVTAPVHYTVIGTNESGCMDTASVRIDVRYPSSVFIPSAFTPNGDGRNDVFQISGLKFETLEAFRIFNRWGQQVFYTTNPSTGWDGTFNSVPQDPEVYYYYITLKLPGSDIKPLKGDLTLIR